jgi:hypothetical protein
MDSTSPALDVEEKPQQIPSSASPLPVAEEAAHQLPAPDVAETPMECSWKQAYCEHENGLDAFLATLEKGCMAVDQLQDLFFESCIAVFPDLQQPTENCTKFGSLQSFAKFHREWTEMKLKSDSSAADVSSAQLKMDTKLVRCFKDLFFIGPLQMPSMTFCGSVDVAAMMKKQPFNGYNERTISVVVGNSSLLIVCVWTLKKNILCFIRQEAQELVAKMVNNYEGLGNESIFLMCKNPVATNPTAYIKDWSSPLETNQQKLDLLQQFCRKTFNNVAFVPSLFIPCSGKHV